MIMCNEPIEFPFAFCLTVGQNWILSVKMVLIIAVEICLSFHNPTIFGIGVPSWKALICLVSLYNV